MKREKQSRPLLFGAGQPVPVGTPDNAAPVFFHDGAFKLPLLLPKTKLAEKQTIQRAALSPQHRSQYRQDNVQKQFVLQNRKLVVPQSLTSVKVMKLGTGK